VPLAGGGRERYIPGMRRFIPFLKAPARVAMIRLQGVIAAGGRTGVGLNDATLAPLIERAFRRGRPQAVALAINSPGGSPVQSSLIAARIRRLADERKIPVHAFVEDIAASGGYWLALAADDIWVDASSVVGSKSFLDPFRPERPEDVVRLHAILNPVHATFMAEVRARRGARLAEGQDLFNGDVWVGQGAVDQGLADGVAHPVVKLKALYGDKVRIIPYGVKRPLLQRLGGRILGQAIEQIEERAAYARFGL